MPRVPLIVTLAAAALGAAALASGPTPAHAWQSKINIDWSLDSLYSSVNLTEGRCWGRPAPSDASTGRAILSSDQATLVWTADGDLRLEPTSSFVDYLWSSGTAGVGKALCFRSSGSLVIKDEAGNVIWSRSGPSVPIWQNQGDSFEIELAIDGCSLRAGFTRTKFLQGVVDSGTVWSTPATCPPTPDAGIRNGWCADTSEEQTLVKTRWSELVWTTDGNLRLRGLGTAAGSNLWTASWANTLYPAAKLCFEDSGRLAIYNTNGGVAWSQGAPGATGTYYLGLNDCSIETRASAGGNQLWSKPVACPQFRASTGRTWYLAASDQLLVENDDARLFFTPLGKLSLRDAQGNEYWASAESSYMGTSARLQTDGNLVVYNLGMSSNFATGTAGQGVTQLALEGCALRLVAGTVVKWQVGSTTCATTLDNSTPWSMPASGDLTVLRTPEAKLIWWDNGNLVLYTLGGSILWQSSTGGSGRRLDFQADGNLVIYDAASHAVWSSDTDGVTGPVRFELGDECTIRLVAGGITRKTLHTSCKVTQYEFKKDDGNSTLGSSNRSALTTELSAGLARIENASSFAVSLLGAKVELLGAEARRLATEAGVETEEALVSVLGESGLSPNVEVEKLFLGAETTYFVGPIPVTTKYGIEGELGLSIGAESGALVATPHAGLFLMAEAAVGGGWGPLGAKAGIEGSITIVEVELPFRLDITTTDGHHRYELRGDVHIETLSGTVGLFAKAWVKIGPLKIPAEWSYELFGWKGLTWDKKLFSKSGDF